MGKVLTNLREKLPLGLYFYIGMPSMNWRTYYFISTFDSCLHPAALLRYTHQQQYASQLFGCTLISHYKAD